MNSKKKNTIVTTLAIIVILITLVGASYAYFIDQGRGSYSGVDVSATSSTTDLLTFEISNDIDIQINRDNLDIGDDSVSGEATATATLRANNATNVAKERYNLNINITENPLIYSGTHDEETGEYDYVLNIKTNNPWLCLSSTDYYGVASATAEACNTQTYANDGTCDCKNIYSIDFSDINSNQDKAYLMTSVLRFYDYLLVYNNGGVVKSYKNEPYHVVPLISANEKYEVEKVSFINSNMGTAAYIFDNAANYENLSNNTESYIKSRPHIMTLNRFLGNWTSCATIKEGPTLCQENYNTNNEFINALKDELVESGYLIASGSYYHPISDSNNRYYELTYAMELLASNNYITSDVNYLEKFVNTGYLVEKRATETVAGASELLLQVLPPNGVTLNSISGLEYVTVEDGQGNEISGYDITSKEGIISLADSLIIEVTNSNQSGITEHEWLIRIIFVNLDTDQNANGGKEIRATITMTKEAKPTYAVTFNTGGGSTVESQQVIEDRKATRPDNPTKENAVFVEWQLNGEPFDFTTKIEDNITLTAVWRNVYTVTFDSSGGNAIAPQQILDGNYATEPEDPVKTNASFVEWQLNDEEFDFDTPITSNIILTAKWLNIYDVTFDSNGGSSVNPQRVLEGHTATRPTDPTKEDYEFVGWRLNGRMYDFNSLVTSDIDLVAKWNSLYAYNGEIYHKISKWVYFDSPEKWCFAQIEGIDEKELECSERSFASEEACNAALDDLFEEVAQYISEQQLTVYRYMYKCMQAASNIVPEEGTKWVVHISNNEYQEDYDFLALDTHEDCTNLIAASGYTEGVLNENDGYTYTCVEKTGEFGGIGEYQTELDDILDTPYNLYCAVEEGEEECSGKYYTYNECLSDIDPETEACVELPITVPVYIKHEVEDDLLIDGSVCLYLNNHELCLNNDYWVETGNGDENHASEENGLATLNKLKTELLTTLNLNEQEIGCESGNSWFSCEYEEDDVEYIVDCGSSSSSVECQYMITTQDGEVEYEIWIQQPNEIEIEYEYQSNIDSYTYACFIENEEGASFANCWVWF